MKNRIQGFRGSRGKNWNIEKTVTSFELRVSGWQRLASIRKSWGQIFILDFTRNREN